MAAFGSLQSIFENPLPENPTLIESLSQWKHISFKKPIELTSITEIFGELIFKENPQSPSSSHLHPHIQNLDHENNKNQSELASLLNTHKNQYVGWPKNGDGFSSKNLERLQLCTEGLGSESTDEVEDLDSMKERGDDWKRKEEKASLTKHSSFENQRGEFRRLRATKGTLPPPISSIGWAGKPLVCFKSYRHDGRFVLKEIRIPTQEFLHACREDGRLKLHFVHPDREMQEEEEGDEDGDVEDFEDEVGNTYKEEIGEDA